MNPAPNLILVGPMGAGKSSIGRQIAEQYHLSFVDIDQLIVERTGKSICQLFATVRESGFRAIERQITLEILHQKQHVIATGGGVVLDDTIRLRLQTGGFIVYLAVGVAAQMRRLAHDKLRPLLPQTNQRQHLMMMADQRHPLYQEIADLTLQTDQYSCQDAAMHLDMLLARHWQRNPSMP